MRSLRHSLCLTYLLALSVAFVGSTAHADPITGVAGGTAAPGATLGPYGMTPFGPDPSPEYTIVTSVASPLGGDVTFGTPTDHRQVGSGWLTWSHGYTGDVYYTRGANILSMFMPTNTGAFYFYAEPNNRSPFLMTAIANDGTTVAQTVDGNAGASYYGFYTEPGVTLSSVTISSQFDFAVGEFGIARSVPGAPPGPVVPVPAAVWGGMALLGGLGVTKRLRGGKDLVAESAR